MGESNIKPMDEENDCNKKIEPVCDGVKPEKGYDHSTEDAGIVAGSMVSLVSDPTKIGAVIAINNGVYTVWLDNLPRTFFKNQIQMIASPVSNRNRLSLAKVKSAITAYQINNPDSVSLYSLNSARIDFVPYQFRPALKIIKSDSPRLLIADDVGVGKTIEAGLILKELEARAGIDSVLIICPRPLVAERKWVMEMKRFDENFTQLNGFELSECILEADRDGEWPERHKKTIIPYSLFGEESLLGTVPKQNKKHGKMGLLQLDPPPHFDLVIVDEAHNIRNSNTYAYQGVEYFSQNADAVILLTATPLQNSNNDLYTLLNLLRPDVVSDKDSFKTMAEPNVFVNSLLQTVRNQGNEWRKEAKEEIDRILSTTWGRNVISHNPNFAKVMQYIEQDEINREEKVEAIGLVESLHSFDTMLTRTRRKDIEGFCVRHTQTLRVKFSFEQQKIYDSLMDFEASTIAQMHGSQSIRFMMCTIMRQAASCIYGLVPFIDDIVMKRLERILEDGELYERDSLMVSDWTESVMKLAENLDELTNNISTNDPKLEMLYDVIDRKQREENNRIIIFSSFRHTLGYLRKNLLERGYRVAQVDGSVADDERFKIRERFLMDRSEEQAIDILLFTEVGCEGLDYQFCDTMINYDLPWNPMRIEQRIGRIDRRGQKSETVRIYNFITDGTIDAVVYDRCLTKIGVFESSIGECSEILGDMSEKILKIMLEPGLSVEERQLKMEKMADNEVLKVQEINRLEQEEKTLYGFDLSNYIHDKGVKDAESAWITPENISTLVDSFLADFIGEGEYIKSNKSNELCNLRIGSEKKQILLDDLKKLQLTGNNNAVRTWNAYLKSANSQIKVTYDAATARDNRDALFFTQLHPLVQQAAKHQSKQLPCEVGIYVCDDAIPNGDYEFIIYSWQYVGFRPNVKLIVVSGHEFIKDRFMYYLKTGTDYEYDDRAFLNKWDSIDGLHYNMWENAKKEYVEMIREECEFRTEQLTQSFTKREQILNGQIMNSTDERILRMRTSQLDNLRNTFKQQKMKIEEAVNRADINTQMLVKGVVHVE